VFPFNYIQSTLGWNSRTDQLSEEDGYVDLVI